MYGFQSYISVPILLPGGSFFGTLCAIDPRPARLDAPEIVGMFTLFAEPIAAHLGAMDRMEAAEASLLGERRTAALREEFIAVLGHDLRNPLAAIDGGLRLIERTPLNDKATRILGMVGKSVARMAGLLDNIMDFAQGRLGGGLALQRDAGRPLLPVLAQIVDEIRVSAPGRVIMTDFRLAEPVDCDRRRIGQLLSHLLGNAVTHGADTAPIRAEAVAAELVKDGVARNIISIQGFGDTHLLVPTGPGVREPQNRRVEIILK